MKKYLGEIRNEPERPDNPVLDRIGSIFEKRVASLEADKQQLKDDLSNVLQRGAPKEKKSVEPSVKTRIDRITKLIGAEIKYNGSFKRGDKQYTLSEEEGNFELYFVLAGDTIKEFWYLSAHTGSFDYKDDLADLRVLMQNCVNQGGTRCKFIIATNDDLSVLRKEITTTFNKMKSKLPTKYRSHFKLEIWDNSGLLEVEKNLGLKVDL